LARRFFYQPGGFINRRFWWLGTRKYTFWGGVAGLGLFLVLFLVFWYPIVVGYISGVLTDWLLGVSIHLITRYFLRHTSSQLKIIGWITLLLFGALSVLLGIQVSNWVGASLSAWWPPVEWLFLDTFLIGVFGGNGLRQLSER
jgi:hypothetical protein